MLEANEKNFVELIQKNKIVVADFWATWCKPCFTVEQILKQLEQKYNHNTLFIKINTDDNLSVARTYNILSLPTVMIFKDGEPVKRIVGSKSIYDFEDAIEEAMAE